MIENILIVVPPLVNHKKSGALNHNPPNFEDFRLVSPIEPMTATANLIDCGFNTKVFDMGLFLTDRLTHLESEMNSFKPDAFVMIQSILTFATAQDWNGKDAFDLCKKLYPNCLTILTGSHATNYPGKAVQERICDYSIKGEVDFVLSDIFSKINKAETIENVEGVSFLKADGNLHISINYPKVDVCKLPLPAYHILTEKQIRGYADILEFGKIRFPEKSKFYRDIMTSRSCSLRCMFCSVANFRGGSQPRRKKTTHQILKEVDQALSAGIKEIHFFDDLFASDEGEILDLCDAFRNRGFHFPWFVAQGLPLWPVTQDALKAMVETGMYRIICPFESGADRVLQKVIGKIHSSIDHHHRVVEWASKCGLEIIGMFVVGLPGELRNELLATMQFAEAHPQIDYSVFSIATPMIGTRLMRNVVAQGRLDDQGSIDRIIKRTVALYETEEFSHYELGVIRAFDWDRINFSTKSRQLKYSQMVGITHEQLEQMRTHSKKAFHQFFPDYDGPLSFSELYGKQNLFKHLKPVIPAEAY